MGLEKINEFKKIKGLTNSQLADLSGVTLSTLDKITSGNNTNPKLSTLQAICRVLGCSLDDLDDTNLKETISSEEQKMIKKYRALDEHGIDMVNTVLEKEYTRVIAQKEKTQSKDETPKVYRIPVAARGGGVSYVEQTQEEHDKAEKLIREKYPELLGKSNID